MIAKQESAAARLLKPVKITRFLDAKPKMDAEKRAHRGLHKEKRRLSRKVSCDMRFLCTHIEKKVLKAGLDTADRRLDNVRRMFEAAGEDVGSGSVNLRKGQLKWRTLVG
jgi:hypothetical protein